MLSEDLNDISLLSEKIEKALEDYNFIELASLASKLEKIVQLVTEDSSYRKNINKEELQTLKNLIVRVNQYQAKTATKFKDYTLRVAKQTKMRNAYNQGRS